MRRSAPLQSSGGLLSLAGKISGRTKRRLGVLPAGRGGGTSGDRQQLGTAPAVPRLCSGGGQRGGAAVVSLRPSHHFGTACPRTAGNCLATPTTCPSTSASFGWAKVSGWQGDSGWGCRIRLPFCREHQVQA